MINVYSYSKSLVAEIFLVKLIAQQNYSSTMSGIIADGLMDDGILVTMNNLTIMSENQIVHSKLTAIIANEQVMAPKNSSIEAITHQTKWW